jgi:pyruvate/2-oxoacid:ferredoxin oxidoreductase beta subunit
VLKAAHAHQGAAFIEIFQNCIVYNDDVFEPIHSQAEGRLSSTSSGASRASRCSLRAAMQGVSRSMPSG